MTDVNLDIAARAREDVALIESTLEKVGVTLNMDESKQFFATGTEFIPSGKSKWKQMRKAIDSLPYLTKGLDSLDTLILSEERIDLFDALASFRIDSDGFLSHQGNVPLSLTDYAWNQIRAKAPETFSERLSNNFNKWLNLMAKEQRLRTRKTKIGDERELYAVLSHGNNRSYQPFDVNDASKAFRDLMPKDAKIRIDYERATTRWSMEAVFPNPITVDEAGVGSVHHLGVRCSGADNGSRKFMTEFFVLKAACINCTTITDTTLHFNKPHKGQLFVDHIQETLNKSGLAMQSFSEVWREANEKTIHNKYDGSALTAEQTFKALIHAGYVSLDGKTDEFLLENLMGAWNLAPGDTAAHVNQAITRMAHGGEFNTWQMQELEEQAGELLYQRVYVLEFAE